MEENQEAISVVAGVQAEYLATAARAAMVVQPPSLEVVVVWDQAAAAAEVGKAEVAAVAEVVHPVLEVITAGLVAQVALEHEVEVVLVV